jgi:O-antigen ligase
MVPRDVVRRLATAAGLIALLLILGVVLASAAVSPASNWTVRTILLGFVVLAIARPDVAVMITIAFAGFGIILANLGGVPSLRATELLVVATVAGYGVRALPSESRYRRALADSIPVPVVLLAMAAIASAAVWQRVYQTDVGNVSTYLQALVQFASRDYFVDPGSFLELIPTAVLLESLALYVIVAALCQADSGFFDRAVRMMAIGGAGLAVLSLVRLAEIIIRNPATIQFVRATPVGLRISPQIPDYIAAGSYFALCWLAALGLALGSARQRLIWLAVSVLLIAGLYLTGSRSVIGAAVVGVAVPAFIVMRQKGAAIRGLVAFAVLTVVLMVVSYSWMSGRDFAGAMAWQSLSVRAELMRAGGRVIATRPVFGVGLDRFYMLAGAYASPELRASWTGRMNPHNDFLRFTAELGLIGGAAFLWILVAATIRIWKALSTTREPHLAGLAGGLVAFLVTSLFSNPLAVRDVSFVFWMALGLAVGRSASLLAHPGVAESVANGVANRVSRVGQLRWATLLVIGGLLFFSIPARARQEMRAINPASVSTGLFAWNADADGTRWRWSGPRATLFVDSRVQVVEIPIGGRPSSNVRQDVEIWIDGRLANRVSVGPDWQRLRTILPPRSSIDPHRIELAVSPTWIPAEVIPDSQERRPHGVRVGEIRTTRPSR